MTLYDMVLDTLRTIWAHKLRTALTMFGIAWGIISITLMVAAGEGLRVGQKKVADQFGKDIMLYFAGRTSMQAGGTRAGRPLRWSIQDIPVVQQEATACEVIIPELGSRLNVRSAYNSALLTVVGSLPAFADIRTIPVAEGRFYNDEDNAQARRVAFIGSDSKKQLFGTRAAIGQQVTANGVPFTIIGLMEEKEQDSSYDGRDISKLFIPVNTMLRDFPDKPPRQPYNIDRIIVTPRGMENHLPCKTQVRRSLAKLHDFDPLDKEAAGVWDTVENAKQFQTLTDGMKYFLGAVGIVTLFLGGLGVMNVMLVAVRERTREIGVRKSLGATSGSILRQFFLEALLIVILSGAIGMGIAYGICAAVNTLPMPQYFAGLLPTWHAAALSFVVLGSVAVFSALYPASRAAAVDPIEALRYEAGG
jgi:putative ABC transport system permease protein